MNAHASINITTTLIFYSHNLNYFNWSSIVVRGKKKGSSWNVCSSSECKWNRMEFHTHSQRKGNFNRVQNYSLCDARQELPSWKSLLHLFAGGTGTGPGGASEVVHCGTEQTRSSWGGGGICLRSSTNHHIKRGT